MVHGKLGNENMHAQKWVYVVSFQQCGHIGCIQNRRTRNWEALSIHMKIKKNGNTKRRKTQGWPTLCKCQQVCCLKSKIKKHTSQPDDEMSTQFLLPCHKSKDYIFLWMKILCCYGSTWCLFFLTLHSATHLLCLHCPPGIKRLKIRSLLGKEKKTERRRQMAWRERMANVWGVKLM